jgi:hypothetical protein
MFNLVFQVSLLWFLITLFTRQTNSSQSYTESIIVIIGYIVASILVSLLLGNLLGIFTIFVTGVLLYFIIDKVCGTSRRDTIKICAWFLGIIFLVNLGFGLLQQAINQ